MRQVSPKSVEISHSMPAPKDMEFSQNIGKLFLGFLHMSQDEWQYFLQDKERFQNNASQNPEYCLRHYPHIARSWITSRESGVNITEQMLNQPFLDVQKLNKIQKENEQLINYAKSLFLCFRHKIEDYSPSYTLNLLDQNGVILYNDSTLPRNYPTIVPAWGTIWNDQTVGTNVCSLAYQTQHPILLPGVLHYSNIFEDLLAAASPIRNSSGRLVGLLAYVQKTPIQPWREGYQTIGLQALSIISAIATALESFIQHNEAAETTAKKKNKNYLQGEHTGGTAVYSFSNLIGASQEWLRTVRLGRHYASFDENILLTGESGTGKELFAQAIHNEHRPDGPFIAINCAALPKSLIESELFGYEEGSFTGANRRGQPGKFELSQGGTLFLDEIGDMPLEFQSVLLRVLEDKQVMRIGGRRYRKVDFRLVAATNKNLEHLVSEGKFREDLYFRLSVLNIVLPPLRRRGQDSKLLARYFIDKYSTKWRRPSLELSPEASALILAYDWPGNVRQLENTIIQALATEKSNTIQPSSLPKAVQAGQKLPTREQYAPKDIPVLSNDYSLASWEKSAIQMAMNASDNLIPLAADLLGIGKSTLYRKLREYGLK